MSEMSTWGVKHEDRYNFNGFKIERMDLEMWGKGHQHSMGHTYTKKNYPMFIWNYIRSSFILLSPAILQIYANINLSLD